MDKEVEAVLKKLKDSLQESGLSGAVAYNSVMLLERHKETTRYCANFSVSVKMPEGYTYHKGYSFGPAD
jgi:hypothetical protein